MSEIPKLGCVNHDCDICKQEQGEPVKGLKFIHKADIDLAKKREQEQGEPVAWMQDSIELYVQDHPNQYYTIPLYTTPQQRKPLTDEQIADIVIEMNGNEPPALFWKDLTRAIEAAHGIGEKK